MTCIKLFRMKKFIVHFVICMTLAFAVKAENTKPALAPNKDLTQAIEALASQNYQSAVKTFADHAQKGDGFALFYLGRMYELGFGLPRDVPKSIVLYQESAKTDNILGLTRMGLLHVLGAGVLQDYEKGTGYMEKAATFGHPEAQYTYGTWLQQGLFIPVNPEEGMNWLVKAAENKNIPAQIRVASNFLEGVGTPVKPESAFYWYEQVARQNNLIGLYELGFSYESSRGIEQDLIKAHQFYNLAAQAGHSEATKRLQQLSQKLSYQETRQAQEQAKLWRQEYQ